MGSASWEEVSFRWWVVQEGRRLPRQVPREFGRNCRRVTVCRHGGRPRRLRSAGRLCGERYSVFRPADLGRRGDSDTRVVAVLWAKSREAEGALHWSGSPSPGRPRSGRFFQPSLARQLAVCVCVWPRFKACGFCSARQAGRCVCVCHRASRRRVCVVGLGRRGGAEWWCRGWFQTSKTSLLRGRHGDDWPNRQQSGEQC